MSRRAPFRSEEIRALVTGASRGIGAAIAVELAAAGHPVVINYLSRQDAAQAVKERIEKAGGHAELARFDVASASECSVEIARLMADPRPIGIVVNNAAITVDAPMPALALADWQRVTRTVLDGFFHVTQPLVMPMVGRRWGRIVNVSSVSGVIGNRGQVAYSAAKAGLIGATKALAKELARRGVTVNAVAPGPIETEMLGDVPRDKVLEAIPMRRIGTPEEVAAVVAFLASERASYVTGEVIGIDGGMA